MNYQQLTDYQINNLVHNTLLPERYIVSFRADGAIDWIRDGKVIITTNDIGYSKNGLRNYCNSWADAGPIIQDNAIGIMPFKKGSSEAWSLAAGLLSNTTVKHNNPLRAAMIVFLMMQENK